MPIALAGLAIMPAGSATTVLVPAIAAVLVAAAILIQASRPETGLPLDDSGCWAVLTTTLYVVMPLAVAAVVDGQWTPLNDSRLFAMRPSAALIARVGWYCVVYLATLGIGYLVGTAGRSRDTRRNATPPRIDRSTVIAIGVCFGGAVILVGLLRPDAESYSASYV
ncbi:MAG: hypothetical protein ACREBE_00840, partial [bacterium]